MARRLRHAFDLASDIGAKAADLHAHGDAAAVDALDFLCKVNPDVYSWLLDRLMAVRARRYDERRLAKLRAAKAPRLVGPEGEDVKVRQTGEAE